MIEKLLGKIEEFSQELSRFYDSNDDLESHGIDFMALLEYNLVNVNLSHILNYNDLFQAIPLYAKETYNEKTNNYIMDWEENDIYYTAYLSAENFNKWLALYEL